MNLRSYLFLGYLAGFGYLTTFVSCQNHSHQNGQATEVESEQKYCFLRTEGAQHSDSSYVQLTFQKETVSGIYNVIPAEKDARRGTVLGKLRDDVLDLVWTFTQEGMQDTMRVVFALRDGKLLQKPLSVDTATGRQVTRDTSSFSSVYEPVACTPN